MKNAILYASLFLCFTLSCNPNPKRTRALSGSESQNDPSLTNNQNTSPQESGDLQTSGNSSASGIEIGNGGDAVVCYTEDRKKIDSVKLLDFYKLHEKGTLNSRLSYTIYENLDWLLEKYKLKDLSGYELLKPMVSSFFIEAVFEKNIILEDIQDSGPMALPSKCQIEQIAVFSETPFLGLDTTKHYFISETLWDHLSTIDQAGLVFHEILYRFAVQKGHRNSIHVRALNELLADSQWEAMSDYEFTIFLRRRNFWNLFTSTETICDEILSLHENGNPKTCKFSKERKINIGINQFRMIPCGQRTCRYPEEDLIEFYESGEIKSFTSKVYHFRQSDKCSIGGLDSWQEFYVYTFYKSGKVKNINSSYKNFVDKNLEFFSFLQQIWVDKTCERNLQRKGLLFGASFYESGISRFSTCNVNPANKEATLHPCKFKLYQDVNLGLGGYIYLEAHDENYPIFEHHSSNGLPKRGKIVCGNSENSCALKLKTSATEIGVFHAGDNIAIDEFGLVKEL